MNFAPRINSRRCGRASCQLKASLEIPGVTRAGVPWAMETRDVSEWGLRVSSPSRLPLLPVVVSLRSPCGAELRVSGDVVWSGEAAPGAFESGVEFNDPQLALSSIKIERHQAAP